MNLKKVKIISVLGMIILAFLFHNLYKWIPNTFTSIFFPVNESIWEHMKLLYTTSIVFGIIEYLILYFFDIKLEKNNYFINLSLISFLSIPIYLIMFLPLYYSFGENMFISIGVMIITFIIIEIISYFLLQKLDFKYQEIIGIVLIIIGFSIMGYLTYNPLINDLFLDHKENKYGISYYKM
jgi:hypothetical protein